MCSSHDRTSTPLSSSPSMWREAQAKHFLDPGGAGGDQPEGSFEGHQESPLVSQTSSEDVLCDPVLAARPPLPPRHGAKVWGRQKHKMNRHQLPRKDTTTKSKKAALAIPMPTSSQWRANQCLLVNCLFSPDPVTAESQRLTQGPGTLVTLLPAPALET